MNIVRLDQIGAHLPIINESDDGQEATDREVRVRKRLEKTVTNAQESQRNVR